MLLETGGSIGEICVTGGGSRSLYWGKMLASALNRPLTYRQGSEIGAAFGAARLARMAFSNEAVEAVCTQPPISNVVDPDPAFCSLLAERRTIFTHLYRDLKNAFKEFSR